MLPVYWGLLQRKERDNNRHKLVMPQGRQGNAGNHGRHIPGMEDV